MYSDMDILDGKGFSDLIDIPKIDEIIVNNNLKLRYQLDHIYVRRFVKTFFAYCISQMTDKN